MAHVVVGQFTLAIATILNGLLTIYFWIVIVSALLSWVNPDPYNPIVRFLRAVTEPVLFQIRRRLPFVFAGGIDFSPLVLLIGIQFVKIVVVQSLFELAWEIRRAASAVALDAVV
jgi:YggT family protein